MFEKVNPSHPDKIADRIAGAIVDYAYRQISDPTIAVEVLIGHGKCNIIIESNIYNLLTPTVIEDIVHRICEDNTIKVDLFRIPQDIYLNRNQEGVIKCGDNGIFKGATITSEQRLLTNIAHTLYSNNPHDGKYLIDNNKITICQSWDTEENIRNILSGYNNYNFVINPLGSWKGGIGVDCGATNRKLGSDMGDGITGGGLHGKDLSKADVTLNIYCFLMANTIGEENTYQLSCSIGDDYVDGKSYSEIVDIAKDYIKNIGGFEKLAEWGLIRP